ncbi:MAG: hypothetical protein ACYTAO_11860, partial [Planctomycetota bacterium]
MRSKIPHDDPYCDGQKEIQRQHGQRRRRVPVKGGLGENTRRRQYLQDVLCGDTNRKQTDGHEGHSQALPTAEKHARDHDVKQIGERYVR